MPNIFDFTFEELVSYFQDELKEPSFRATQVWQWLYQKLCFDFAQMSNLKIAIREHLAKTFAHNLPKIKQVRTSSDGTQKLLLELDDSALIETVLIPATDHAGKVRYAQCLSTQVGCPMGCTFCATGSLGFERNLTHGEMVAQVLLARSFLGDSRPDHPIIKNLVFMGMGEPLLNLEQLLKTLKTLNSPQGLAFSPRRITVSTCGIKNALDPLGESGLCYLAISLHAPNQDLRAKIMPKAANFQLPDLLKALKKYPLKPREYLTFEYLLLGGVNDSTTHALELAKIVQSVKGKLNLIVYNETANAPYKAPSTEAVLKFEQVLWDKKITAIVRQSKGSDIEAACGQLRAKYLQET